MTYSASTRMMRRLAWLSGGFALFAVSAIRCELGPAILQKGVGKLPEFTSEFVPPMWSETGTMAHAAAVTLSVAATATLLGLLLALPIALAAASNISPKWLRLPVRMMLAAERAVPEVILLLVFVVAFGLGPLPGLCTLTLASAGMLGKLLGDAIEELDETVIDSVRASGASGLQTIRYGVLPLVLPAATSSALFRLDVNVRASVVLGAVGAGGIGAEIYRSMGMLQYNRATMAVLASLVLIYSAERLSGNLRSRLLVGKT